MEYEFAGFTFEFNQNSDGDVVTITNPPITVDGIAVYPGGIIQLEPAVTVAAAEAMVQAFLGALGVS